MPRRSWADVPPEDPLGPTDAAPGTTEKLRVMADRVARGFRPHHAGDRTALVDRVLRAVRAAGEDVASADPAGLLISCLPNGTGGPDGRRAAYRKNTGRFVGKGAVPGRRVVAARDTVYVKPVKVFHPSR